ncbi:MAG: hypothetical protein K0R46_3257 [Herbinix sp.]|jgi:hypothetical protein|nr:hypothetical protein [Herbinix sp.]
MNSIKHFITASSDIIKKRANFLIEKGFVLQNEDEFIIHYSSNLCLVEIVFERFDDISDINIRFLEKNKSYSISWILRVFEEVNYNDYMINKKDKLINVLGLLNFIEDYFENVTDIVFCESMMGKVEDFPKKRI